jgi:hypothetical protein
MTEGRWSPGEPRRIWPAGEYTLLADSHTTDEGVTARKRWVHRHTQRYASCQSTGRERAGLEARRVPLSDVGACRGVGRLNSRLSAPNGAVTATLRANEAVGLVRRYFTSPRQDEYAVVNEQQSALCQATLSIGPYLLLEGQRLDPTSLSAAPLFSAQLLYLLVHLLQRPPKDVL